MNLYYCIGDALNPIGEKNKKKFLLHICNDVGVWGKGFSKTISDKWKLPLIIFKKEYNFGKFYKLGDIQSVKVEKNLNVINMIAKNGLIHRYEKKSLDYQALKTCLKEVSYRAKLTSTEIHMPRIGCGKSGGDWNIVENILNETLQNLNVYLYDLPILNSEV